MHAALQFTAIRRSCVVIWMSLSMSNNKDKRTNRVYPIKRGDDEKEGQSFDEFKHLHRVKEASSQQQEILKKMNKFTLMFSSEDMEQNFRNGYVIQFSS